MQLQQQLKELEDNIEYSRRYFNAVVRDYNIMTETFPSNIIASQFKFEKSEFFELEEAGAERKPTKVSFS
jgi:LemA protein